MKNKDKKEEKLPVLSPEERAMYGQHVDTDSIVGEDSHDTGRRKKARKRALDVLKKLEK